MSQEVLDRATGALVPYLNSEHRIAPEPAQQLLSNIRRAGEYSWMTGVSRTAEDGQKDVAIYVLANSSGKEHKLAQPFVDLSKAIHPEHKLSLQFIKGVTVDQAYKRIKYSTQEHFVDSEILFCEVIYDTKKQI